MTFSRRDFLRAMLWTSGATAFGTVSMTDLGTALSQPLEPGAPDFRRRFIFCYFGGGWDVLLGADPRDPAVFTEERRGETLIQPAYDRLTGPYSRQGNFYDPDLDITLGPACGPIWPHIREMCIVRGIAMNTVSHQAGMRYLLTGRAPIGLRARGASIPTEIAVQLYGEGAPEDMPIVPNLAYSVESYNDRHPSFASGLKISSVNDLLSALRKPDLGYSDAEERFMTRYLGGHEDYGLPLEAMPAALHRARDSKIQAEAVLAAQLDERFHFPQGINLNSQDAAGVLAVQAITEQICTSVSLRLAGNLDTHGQNWAVQQAPGQEAGFQVVANILQALKDKEYPDGSNVSWLAHTTVVAFSEFSRTPLLNVNEGRDHHPVGSVMMWGAGVPHGKVVGASSDRGMLNQPIDLHTGLPDPNGVDIRPEDLMGTLLANAGMDNSFLGSDVQFIHALEA
jgi:hypothetical protein